jgi:hypothetical protein
VEEPSTASLPDHRDAPHHEADPKRPPQPLEDVN